jgi:hypothetical protein
MSLTKQKILLLLFSGLALGYTYLPSHQWRILKGVAREWKKIDERKLREEIRQLYQSKLLDRKENSDGSITLFLTEKRRSKP